MTLGPCEKLLGNRKKKNDCFVVWLSLEVNEVLRTEKKARCGGSCP